MAPARVKVDMAFGVVLRGVPAVTQGLKKQGKYSKFNEKIEKEASKGTLKDHHRGDSEGPNTQGPP